MRRTPHTRLFAASVAMLASLTLAACGDDDGDDTVTTDAAPETLDGSDVTASTSGGSDTTSGAGSETTTAGTAGGEVGSQDEYLEVARDEFADEFDEAGVSDCIAEALVNDDVYAAIRDTGLTLEEFEEDGPTSLGLDETVAGPIAAEIAACGDLVELFDEEDRACAEGSVTNEQIAEFLAFTLVGATPDEELQAAFADIEACADGSTSTT